MKEIKSLEGYSLSSLNFALIKRRQTRLSLYIKFAAIAGVSLLLGSIFLFDFLFIPSVLGILLFLFCFRFLLPDKRRYKCEKCGNTMSKRVYKTHKKQAEEIVFICSSCRSFFKTGVYYD